MGGFSCVVLRLEGRAQECLHGVDGPQDDEERHARVDVLVEGRVLDVVVVERYGETERDEGDGEGAAEGHGARVGKGSVGH